MAHMPPFVPNPPPAVRIEFRPNEVVFRRLSNQFMQRQEFKVIFTF
jgi:hypothetical protein